MYRLLHATAPAYLRLRFSQSRTPFSATLRTTRDSDFLEQNLSTEKESPCCLAFCFKESWRKAASAKRLWIVYSVFTVIHERACEETMFKTKKKSPDTDAGKLQGNTKASIVSSEIFANLAQLKRNRLYLSSQATHNCYTFFCGSPSKPVGSGLLKSAPMPVLVCISESGIQKFHCGERPVVLRR